MYGSTFLSPLFSFYFYLFIYLFYNFSSFWISWLEFKCLYLGNTLSILLQYSTGSISVFHLCSTKGIPTQFSIGTSWWVAPRDYLQHIPPLLPHRVFPWDLTLGFAWILHHVWPKENWDHIPFVLISLRNWWKTESVFHRSHLEENWELCWNPMWDQRTTRL